LEMPVSAGPKKADQMTADTEHIWQEFSERLNIIYSPPGP